MTFSHALLLFLLVIPATIGVWVWLRSSSRVVLPFDHALPSSGRRWHIIIGVAETIPALLLALAVILAAGPQVFGEPKTKRALTNIEFCLDVSGSMVSQYGEATRYDAAMKSLEAFLDFRKGDAFGLTFFGASVLHWCPLTSDASAIRCSPPFMRPEAIPIWLSGGTEIAAALRACKKILETRPDGDRMIILITDGEAYDLFGNDSAIVKQMTEAKITVWAVIIGMEAIQSEIEAITNGTGGKAFLAGDPDTLQAVFKKIDQMQPTKMEKSIAEASDWFVPYCIAGLSLIGFSLLSLFGIRYTPW
jgi:Ca-activated chloride channel family protein